MRPEICFVFERLIESLSTLHLQQEEIITPAHKPFCCYNLWVHKAATLNELCHG